MVAEEPKVNITGKYPISEAAAALGYSRRHLLRLADEGLIGFVCSRKNGRKYFTGREILRFWKTN